MIQILIFITLGFVAYFMGAIPTAVWYGKWFHNVDVREHGSKNAGATNTFRVLGQKAGIIVFIIDVLKGFAATSMANLLYFDDRIWDYEVAEFKILYGLLAVFGHIYSVFIGFKGGKGVATSLGLGLCMFPTVALICFGIFLIILYLSKYVSVGSMAATLAFPLLMLTSWFTPDDYLITIFGFMAFLLVVYTHRKNIVRLINGEENKVYLIKKRG
ncbi:MAG: glycerol-3-phosphate 1-O-acyltransferase PlsY [Cytophagales bacterium]|nr:glycerol-3-phosphate 1-O-acyltransferase PlsY [Cytophagales bacterium]